MKKSNIFLLIILLSGSCAYADELNTSTQVSANTPITTTNSAQPFKLSATKVVVSLDQLNDVGLDLKHILTISRHLYDEVMIQPMNVITEPEMIGTGVVINLPVALEPTGPPRPARKDRVDLLMGELRPVIDLFIKNGNEFLSDNQEAKYPQEMKDKLAPLMKTWTGHADDLYARLLVLEKQTVGPTYDNYAIASTIKDIETDIQKIDEVRRPIYKLVQEEGKRLMADQNNQQ